MSDQCPRCGGELKTHTTTIEYSQGDKSGHIQNMKYLQCEKCGEQLFDLEVLKRLLEDSAETDGSGDKPNLPN